MFRSRPQTCVRRVWRDFEENLTLLSDVCGFSPFFLCKLLYNLFLKVPDMLPVFFHFTNFFVHNSFSSSAFCKRFECFRTNWEKFGTLNHVNFFWTIVYFRSWGVRDLCIRQILPLQFEAKRGAPPFQTSKTNRRRTLVWNGFISVFTY